MLFRKKQFNLLGNFKTNLTGKSKTNLTINQVLDCCGCPEIDLVTSGLVLNLEGSNSLSLENGSSTWNDLTSNGYDGTMLNGASYTADKQGGVEFDGLDDTLDLGTILDGVLAGTSPTYTIQAWIKFDELVDDVPYAFFTKYGSGNNRQLLVLVRNITAQSYGGIRLEHIPYTSPGLTGSLPSARVVRTNGPTTIESSKIHNLTITFDGSINTNDGLDRPTFYIDGVLQSKVLAASSNPLTNIFQPTSTKVALNGFIGTGTIPTFPFAGTTHQTLVYDRVLTQEEVTQNFNTLNCIYGT